MSAMSPIQPVPTGATAKQSLEGSAKTQLATTARAAILAGIILALLLTGCTVTTSGHPAAAPDLGHWQPPPILPLHLADLLLNENDVNTIGHTTAMAVRQPVSRMWHDETAVSNTGCLDIYSPAEATVYQGSNWTAVQGQNLDDTGPRGAQHALIQALVSFRDANSAQQFFSQAKTRWSDCANRSLTVTPSGHRPVTFSFGDVQGTEATLSATQTQLGSDGFTCQRAIGLVNNVIVDTLWCGFDTTSQASDIVAKTTAAIAQA